MAHLPKFHWKHQQLIACRVDRTLSGLAQLSIPLIIIVLALSVQGRDIWVKVWSNRSNSWRSIRFWSNSRGVFPEPTIRWALKELWRPVLIASKNSGIIPIQRKEILLVRRLSNLSQMSQNKLHRAQPFTTCEPTTDTSLNNSWWKFRRRQVVPRPSTRPYWTTTINHYKIRTTTRATTTIL